VVDADKAGERPCLAESATGPMEKLPHDGSVTVWPCPSVPLWPQIFAFGLANADEEVSAVWRALVALNWLGKIRRASTVRPAIQPRGVRP
jgi:hypothetical protein